MNSIRTSVPMSNEQIQRVAPSVFAGQSHESRSSRYTFIPTIDVVDGLRQNGFSPVAVRQSLSRVEGKEFFTKHMVRFRAEGQELAQVGDTSVELILVNSHDGTSQYELSLGAFRLACLNGMCVAEGVTEVVKVRHSGNIIDRVIELTSNLIEFAPKVVDSIRRWKEITLTAPEQKFLAEGALALRFEDNPPVSADKVLQVRRNSDTGSDLWTTFNRVQENVTRGGLRYIQPTVYAENGTVAQYSRRNRTREVKGIDQNTKLNRELWALAEKMAELKA